MIYPLRIPLPLFDSQIVEDIVELERLKTRVLDGTTHPAVFFEIKSIFHLLESLGSARIEGNRTTIDDLVEARIMDKEDSSEDLREIANIEDAMDYVDRSFASAPDFPIDRQFICELHRLAVKNLRSPLDGGEGDIAPGTYRGGAIRILNAEHVPPPPTVVEDLMNELIAFIDGSSNSRTELLRIAMAHHRFTYIHPFRNGNGHTVRLLTYAMLVKSGFRVNDGRILNPTAVFCRNRSVYKDALARADRGDDEALLDWCAFVLDGLRTELTKVDHLLDAHYLREAILLPALRNAHERNVISDDQRRILSRMIDEQEVSAQFFAAQYPGKSPSAVSQIIAGLKVRRLVRPFPLPNSRKYILDISRGPLLRVVMESLDDAGFLPMRRDA